MEWHQSDYTYIICIGLVLWCVAIECSCNCTSSYICKTRHTWSIANVIRSCVLLLITFSILLLFSFVNKKKKLKVHNTSFECNRIEHNHKTPNSQLRKAICCEFRWPCFVHFIRNIVRWISSIGTINVITNHLYTHNKTIAATLTSIETLFSAR